MRNSSILGMRVPAYGLELASSNSRFGKELLQIPSMSSQMATSREHLPWTQPRLSFANDPHAVM